MSSGLGEGVADWDVLVPSRSSDSCGGPGACILTRLQLYGVSSDTLVWLASGLSKQCVKKQCSLAGSCFRGRMALDLSLSRVHTGVAAMEQDCNYQLYITKLERKMGNILKCTSFNIKCNIGASFLLFKRSKESKRHFVQRPIRFSSIGIKIN